MIMGIGTDLIDIARVSQALSHPRAGSRFAARVLSAAEQELAAARHTARQAEFIAGRFAAKEAIVKALGCGIGEKAGFRDIEILPDASGKPVVALSMRTRDALRLGDRDVVHISITHTGQQAMAYALWERR